MVATAKEPAHPQCAMANVFLNEKPVCSDGAVDVLALLRRYATTHRLKLDARSLDQQPLVVVDAIALHEGVPRLADILVNHVESILVLQPREAVARYGPKAAHGAILIITRSGRAQPRLRPH